MLADDGFIVGVIFEKHIPMPTVGDDGRFLHIVFGCLTQVKKIASVAVYGVGVGKERVLAVGLELKKNVPSPHLTVIMQLAQGVVKENTLVKYGCGVVFGAQCRIDETVIKNVLASSEVAIVIIVMPCKTLFVR